MKIACKAGVHSHKQNTHEGHITDITPKKKPDI